MNILAMCHMCRTVHVIEVPKNDYMKWNNGMLIQDAMPYLSPAQREMLISNTCDKCFDDLFQGVDHE